ncbi:hypothetical protein AJ80_06773 [Polytolypa hystricis UAMH7299]|uniref:Interferon-related developmental regulator N-terminal domain-containing protein n=1 Tax=Polytolypa hystricis (strain UAMH7299) TaxID=1447883 RepID=A0A2B7XTG7_POLH7|nr:hypothetical protein AJ80_06773 [Polytolypa hystricis UAMH7299]
MHDLRRQALESKKTVSRKQQSRDASRASSRAQSAQNSPQSSRNASRNVSRHPSDDEDTQSDTTAWSSASLDDFFAGETEEETPLEQAQIELKDLITEITDRKRSSVQGREIALGTYIRILSSHNMEEGIDGHVNDLLAAFAKSIKLESSEKETTLALKAVALTAVTTSGDTVYDLMQSLVRRTATDSTSLPVKAAAIHCLGAISFFSGVDDEGLLEQMTFLLEIISSDGHYIDAPDDAAAVTAALEEWGFLATEVDDLEADSADAIEAFTDQLESSDAGVQIAAGENIALCYEKSYSPQREGESLPDDDEDEIEDNFTGEEPYSTISDDEDDDGARLIKRYDAYHNTRHIMNVVDSLAHVSGRHINRKSKRSLHSNFSSILNTIENPRRGPQYSKAIDSETHQHYGSRKTVKIQDNTYMRLDRWWKWLRLAGLRRVLGGGFVLHYFEGNRAVLDCLPVMVTQFNSGGSGRANKPSRKGRRRKATELLG